MQDDVMKQLQAAINKSLEGLKQELSKIRTGRASLSILDGVKVNYYGTPTPLSGVASLAIPEPRLITIKPWEKSVIKDIEKALAEANLGLTPMNDGEIIRLPLPPLTEERRKEIAKQVRTKGEEHKVAVRNERRDANERMKALQKDKKISEDDLEARDGEGAEETDAGITKVDEIIAKKEKEVLEV